MKRTAIVVSHTHWDREWYLPFQEFRMRLVDLVDALLDLLSRNPDFRHFMLDGQAVILDDYLEDRPERRAELSRHVAEGRISIGPWYTLPDEALVSGEALLRNLMAGERSAAPIGAVMPVGYLPDTFGHIDQLPQIIRGWGLKAVVVTRGVPDSPCEFLWDGPDGIPVLTINLRRGYGNALYLAPDENLLPKIQRTVDELAPYATTPFLLFMNGTDHHSPEDTVPEALRQANAALTDVELIHGSLEEFVDSVIAYATVLEHRSGEMRDHQVHYVLPGVLSTRIWIKQRNAALQRLMERWAEPFAAWAHLLGSRDRRPLIWQAWRYLLQNHAHDSICGCSIDQVHEEMKPRFDWVGQIGDRVTQESLDWIGQQEISLPGPQANRVLVFNGECGARTDVVETRLQLPLVGDDLWLKDESTGEAISVEVLRKVEETPLTFKADANTALLLLAQMAEGRLLDKALLGMNMRREGNDVYLNCTAANVGGPDPAELASFMDALDRLARSGEDLTFHYHIQYAPQVDVRFVARQVPAMGYKVLSLTAGRRPASPEDANSNDSISNECFVVHASEDGTLRLLDERLGRTFSGLNRLVDGGDAGDEYNYSPPLSKDCIVDAPSSTATVSIDKTVVGERMRIRTVYQVPTALTADRKARASATVQVPVQMTVSLYAGVPRVDIMAEVTNQASDHRLRVHFPTGITSPVAWADSAFDVVSRPVGTPHFDESWRERPVGTWPQQSFVDVNDGGTGLMVASDGLPEYEVAAGAEGNIIVLTLLRCVGWLSRGDLLTRDANAGPTLATPAAQCHDTYQFRYCIIPHTGDWSEAFLHAREFVNPLRALQVWGAPAGQTSCSLVEATPSSVIVSAVKQPERGEGLVVRVYNPLPRPVQVGLHLGLPFESATLVNLREEPLPSCTTEAVTSFAAPDHFQMQLPAKRIQTIWFRGCSPSRILR